MKYRTENISNSKFSIKMCILLKLNNLLKKKKDRNIDNAATLICSNCNNVFKNHRLNYSDCLVFLALISHFNIPHVH